MRQRARFLKPTLTGDFHFAARHRVPNLGRMAALSEQEFRDMFRVTWAIAKLNACGGP